MVVCKVVGHVWATKKEPSLEGLKLMLVQEDTGSGKASIQVAADVVGDVPMDMAIVGIIDSMEQVSVPKKK